MFVSVVYLYQQHCIYFAETTYLLFAQHYSFIRICCKYSKNCSSTVIESLIYIILRLLFVQSFVRLIRAEFQYFSLRISHSFLYRRIINKFIYLFSFIHSIYYKFNNTNTHVILSIVLIYYSGLLPKLQAVSKIICTHYDNMLVSMPIIILVILNSIIVSDYHI